MRQKHPTPQTLCWLRVVFAGSVRFAHVRESEVGGLGVKRKRVSENKERRKVVGERMACACMREGGREKESE